ncbi:MAG TPA: SCP2 sterol-binding domain-containing protein [Acidimicrobiia bacterium]|nr:SCP2 sterol-binding domain-containing protein [Acidimicrobiia bacterium]
MAVKFLSAEWADQVTSTLNSHPGFKSAIGNTDLGIAFNVSDGPDGDVGYYLKTSGGNADLALGQLEGADVTVGSTYDTAVSISKGELNTQTAFMTGKLKVSGNLAKLMMQQAAITQWAAAVKDMEIEY